MSTPVQPPDGHVVHLLQHWGDGAPPQSLRVRPRLGRLARVVLAVVLTAAAVLGGAAIASLWLFETPGWWFSVLFTLMIGGVVLGFWVGFIDVLRSGVRRELAAARWVEIAAGARPTPGVVIARQVGSSDVGTVPTFDLVVRIAPAATLAATWRPQASSRRLLPSQVPGVGATVRVWRSEPVVDSEPVVVEVLDPTVVPGATDIPKYVD